MLGLQPAHSRGDLPGRRRSALEQELAREQRPIQRPGREHGRRLLSRTLRSHAGSVPPDPDNSRRPHRRGRRRDVHHVDPACRRRVGDDRRVDTPARPPATVLLDLDGTLIDSAPGILGSLAAAFAELGIPLPDGGLPRTLLGPPLYRSLPQLVGADLAPQVLAAYRRIYGEAGIRECVPFDGIDPLLRDLAGDGVTLAVATSKAQVYAEKIVEHRGLDGAVRDGLRRHARRRSARRRRTSSARRCAASAGRLTRSWSATGCTTSRAPARTGSTASAWAGATRRPASWRRRAR